MPKQNKPTPEQPVAFSRDELFKLMDRVRCIRDTAGCNSEWKRLYGRLYDELNNLDAFIARTEVK